MASKRESVGSTRQYPAGDSKYPSRLSRGVELPALKPAKGNIGPYELVAELGSGGMGTVYVARRSYEVGVTRTVALKTLRKDLSSQTDLVEMFLDEARITARISHPYVCSVMDIGTERGVPYVTMDYLVGEPLSRLGPLMADDRTEASLANIVRVIANLCEGLHAAHELRDERGEPMHVVHRDISPDNLFVLYDGSVRVADFGIACTAEHQKDGRSAGLAGKSGYMSPEQLRGLSVDRRADVWSMGVVLWEMLAGKRLFRPGGEIAATVAVLERPIPAVSTLNKEVPKGLDVVISRALERDRDKRYPTARAMALDLEQVLVRCFGSVSAGQVSNWLDQQFPGCQNFRRTIVSLASDMQAQVERLEFDPLNGMLISTRPPADNDSSSVFARMAAEARKVDSLASLDVQLQDDPAAPPAEVITNEALINLDGFSHLLATPQSRPSSLLDSIPAPRKRLMAVLIGIGALGMLGSAVVAFTGSSRPSPAPIVKQAPVAAPVVQAPPPEVTAPVANEPPPIIEETPTVAVEPEVPAAPVVEPAPEPPAKRLSRHDTKPVEKQDWQPAGEAKSQVPIGEVYVYASSGSYDVLLKGKVIHAPALLKLPITTDTITVRKTDSGETTQVSVEPQPGRPMMRRLD